MVSILVFPSFGEDLPVSMIEVLALGLAVMCTPVGTFPDIIEKNTTGLIIKPSNVEALAVVLGRPIEDPHLRRRLVKAGKALQRTRLDVSVRAERLVATWTETVHAGAR